MNKPAVAEEDAEPESPSKLKEIKKQSKVNESCRLHLRDMINFKLALRKSRIFLVGQVLLVWLF